MPDTETKSVPDTLSDDAAADAEVAAGRFIPHDKVVEWLESWGTPNELPCPEPEPC
jgi:predicted transcriptional regulator